MRHPRFFTTPLLISLVANGCDAESEPVDSEQQLDMSLLEQDDDGEWYAPIGEGSPHDLTAKNDPASNSAVHNHLLGGNGIISEWIIHRDGLCGSTASYQQHCNDIGVYIGAYSWYSHSPVSTGCTPGYLKSLRCTTTY